MSTVTTAPNDAGRKRRARDFVPIQALDAVPEPMDEAVAAGYYGTHEFTAEALDQLPDVSDAFSGSYVPTRPISIRLPQPMLAGIEVLAARKGVAYQALIRIWLAERLQRERHVLAGAGPARR